MCDWSVPVRSRPRHVRAGLGINAMVPFSIRRCLHVTTCRPASASVRLQHDSGAPHPGPSGTPTPGAPGIRGYLCHVSNLGSWSVGLTDISGWQASSAINRSGWPPPKHIPLPVLQKSMHQAKNQQRQLPMHSSWFKLLRMEPYLW